MESLKIARAQFISVLFWLAGFSLVVNVLLLTMPLYMLQVYDRVLPSRSMDTLIFLSIIAVGALVVLGLLEAVRAVLASRAASRIETALGSDTLRAAMHESRMGAPDIQPVRDLAQLRNFISSRAVFPLLDVPFAPLFIGVLYIIHPVLFWLTLGGAVVLFLIAILNQFVTNGPAIVSGNRQVAAMMTAQAMARNSHTLQAMGMTDNAIKLWGFHNGTSLQAQDSVDGRNAVLSGLSRTVRMGLQIAILGVGALLVLQNEMTAGMIFASSIISGRGLQPIDQIIGSWRQFAATRKAWKSLKEALSDLGETERKTVLQRPKGQFSAQSVLVLSSNGMTSPPILNRINFTIEPGDIVGVIGPSGSGKSTLARLLVGAQKLNSGVIRIDGTDIQNWDSIQLGVHIGYLGQEVEILPGTIAQNIARLANKPDDAAVLKAAKRAQVHNLIQKLPKGYDTLVGPDGLGLSGGQRQRIGLARAFYGDPQLMVLDEPNANLDDDGELALKHALEAAHKAGVTIVLITQRKQVLKSVNKILRLHRGKVDFFGTQAEFLKVLHASRQRQARAQHSGSRSKVSQ